VSPRRASGGLGQLQKSGEHGHQCRIGGKKTEKYAGKEDQKNVSIVPDHSSVSRLSTGVEEQRRLGRSGICIPIELRWPRKDFGLERLPKTAPRAL
jgi:hypothetical protein